MSTNDTHSLLQVFAGSLGLGQVVFYLCAASSDQNSPARSLFLSRTPTSRIVAGVYISPTDPDTPPLALASAHEVRDIFGRVSFRLLSSQSSDGHASCKMFMAHYVVGRISKNYFSGYKAFLRGKIGAFFVVRQI